MRINASPSHRTVNDYRVKTTHTKSKRTASHLISSHLLSSPLTQSPLQFSFRLLLCCSALPYPLSVSFCFPEPNFGVRHRLFALTFPDVTTPHFAILSLFSSLLLFSLSLRSLCCVVLYCVGGLSLSLLSRTFVLCCCYSLSLHFHSLALWSVVVSVSRFSLVISLTYTSVVRSPPVTCTRPPHCTCPSDPIRGRFALSLFAPSPILFCTLSPLSRFSFFCRSYTTPGWICLRLSVVIA